MTEETTKIKNEFVKLRLYGFTVFNFNQKKSNSKGLTGFPDYMIITNKNLIFIEVKTDKDTIKPEQQEVLIKLANLMGKQNSRIYVEIIKTTEYAKKITNRIIKREL